MRKTIRRELFRNIESKALGEEQTNGGVTNQNWNTGSTMTSIGQGTASNQRTGDSIIATSLRAKMSLVNNNSEAAFVRFIIGWLIKPTDVVTESSTPIWRNQQGTFRTFDNGLDNSGGGTAKCTKMQLIDWGLNKSTFEPIYDKVFYIEGRASTATIPQIKRFSVKKLFKKKITFDDSNTGTGYQNVQLVWILVCKNPIQADDNQSPYTIGYTRFMRLTYKDA